MNSTEQQVQVHHRTVMDDDGRHAARVYAEAIYRSAEGQGQVDELRGELAALTGDVFRRTPELELLLASAAVSRDRKQEVLDRVLGGRCSQVLLNTLQVLNQHDRLGLVSVVATEFAALADRKAGRMAVQVRSAVPLNDEQRGRLVQILQEVSARQPLLEETIDPGLLGGLVVQVGDWVYDASVLTRLKSVRGMLIERSSHGIEGGRDRFGN